MFTKIFKSNIVTQNWTCQNSSTLLLTPGKFQFPMSLSYGQVPLDIHCNRNIRNMFFPYSHPTHLWIGNPWNTSYVLTKCDREAIFMKLSSVCWQKSRKQQFAAVHTTWLMLLEMSIEQVTMGRGIIKTPKWQIVRSVYQIANGEITEF